MDKLHGIIPPMITPLAGDDRPDREGTVRLIEHLISGGVHGIFLLGTTGEAQSLSYKCRYEFAGLACGQVNGRVPVLFGITDTSMAESLRMAELARDSGAAAVVAAPPYYFAPSQKELIEYYSALADRLCLPLYLYNMPSHVKVSIDPETVFELAGHPNIAGLKDSSANMVYFQKLLARLGRRDDFSLFVGPEELTGETVLMGGDGGVNGGANLFPALYVSLYEAARQGNISRVRELQATVMKISASLYTIGKYGSSYLKGVKSALSIMGVCDDYLSFPYRKFLPAEREKVRSALEEIRSDLARLGLPGPDIAGK